MPKSKQIGSATSDIELRADGWGRFVSAVHAAAKHGPVHHKPKRRTKSTPKSKKS
jgi:hypothetical protein